MEKRTFRKAFEALRKNEAPVAKKIIVDLCKWPTYNYFYQKMSGVRSLQEKNVKGVNEIRIVENTFKGFGLNAWTGEAV